MAIKASDNFKVYHNPNGPDISTVNRPVIQQDGLYFKDIDGVKPVHNWLAEHSWEYGFIVRYPEGKSDITGILYEPWHFRYVGVELAKELYESGLCLEEYMAKLTAENS